MADEENLLFRPVGRVVIPSFHQVKPMEIFSLPIGALTFERTPGAAARNVDVKGEVRYLLMQPDVEHLALQHDALIAGIQVQDFMDTTHTLVGRTLVKVEDRYANRLYLFLLHVANLAKAAKWGNLLKQECHIPERNDS